jgi:predicted DNA-binding transcriptional regulator YafY
VTLEDPVSAFREGGYVQTSRILRILDELRIAAGRGTGLTMGQLQDRAGEYRKGTSVRTIHRDIEFLQEEGYDVAYTREDGYVLRVNAKRMPPRPRSRSTTAR